MRRFIFFLLAAVFGTTGVSAQNVSPSVEALVFPNPTYGGISWKPNHADQHIMPRHGPNQTSRWAGRSYFFGSQFDGKTAAQQREHIGYFCNLAIRFGTATYGASGYPKITYTTAHWIGLSSAYPGAPKSWTRKIACELRPDLQPPPQSGLSPGPQTYYIFTAYPTH